VLLHGCSGSYDRRGALAVRLRDYAALLNGQGLHALVVDSLTPRGETELCTQRNGRRTLTQRNRRLDALAALEWLARRSDVDPARVGLLGWSNGGSTVLAAINRRHPDVAAAPRPAAFAIAFYPGCASDLRSGFDSVTPLLMLVGADDDWTPAAPCEALAREAHGTAPTIQVYAGAGHGFDSTAPVRLRADVPNGVHPGQGVHVGGNPSAREASRAALQRFIGDVVRP
jgi:dienelactone hydrolase